MRVKVNYLYTPLHPCFCGNRWVFSIYGQEVVDSVPYTTGSCKMMFLVSYLVYSVNYFTCVVMTYLFTVKIPCVFTNNKDQSKWRIKQINHSRQEFMAINNPWAQVVYLFYIYYSRKLLIQISFIQIFT